MQQVIVFELDGATAIMAAAPNIGLTILQIGQKDVPDGLPFWIVDASIITDDYVIEPEVLGEPSGYGGTYQPTPLEV
ncbi:TPA: hypothetical protein R4S64_003426 [Kluyvera georgiana]|nr:hypothetical protein [Kluyvera georgiana]